MLTFVLHLRSCFRTTGSDWEHVMKVEIFLKRMEDFDKINVVYEKVRELPHPSPFDSI